MKPQSLFYVEHDRCWNLADLLADALDSHAPDLLGLSFRILLESSCLCGQQMIDLIEDGKVPGRRIKQPKSHRSIHSGVRSCWKT